MKLLNCPFCGGDASFDKTSDVYVDRYYDCCIVCGQCKARTVWVHSHEDDVSGARKICIRAWNHRHIPPDTITMKRGELEKANCRLQAVITIYQQTGSAKDMRLNAEEALSILDAALKQGEKK